ncbi:hypothetical protein E2562_007637 [Oryza meyeriana var. granulata]|uniref:Uncharacterized protein n=1 Tax=Oryza meyeriana var. granulata TaxID=110450 RepID=A0A6G1DWJ0_9ORYZ|nr:hypothetical protein E2562_007637 [Oryza meyeriana var. granulata]
MAARRAVGLGPPARVFSTANRAVPLAHYAVTSPFHPGCTASLAPPAPAPPPHPGFPHRTFRPPRSPYSPPSSPETLTPPSTLYSLPRIHCSVWYL